MSSIIKVEKLSKTFESKERKKGQRRKLKTVQALKDVSFEIDENEIFGLLGPNGAGKTTLIKCLTTLLLPSSGKAWVNGYSVLDEEDSVRASIGCMLMGDRGLYWKLTGRENLDYFGALYHVPKAVRRDRIDKLADLLHVKDFIDRTVETYSSGQKMLVAFAKSLINDAPILILDEPTVTLDVPTARQLRTIVKELNESGKAILYTTHLMHEAEELCNRVAIMDHGEIIAFGTPSELKASLALDDTLDLEGVFPAKAVEAVRALSGVTQVAMKSKNGGKTSLSIISKSGGTILPQIIEALTHNRATIEQLRPKSATLEDVFIAKTGRTLDVDTRQIVVQRGEPGGGP